MRASNLQICPGNVQFSSVLDGETPPLQCVSRVPAHSGASFVMSSASASDPAPPEVSNIDNWQ